MKKESIFQKIVIFITNFFKIILILILKFIRNIFGSKDSKNKYINKEVDTNIRQKTSDFFNSSQNSLPDEFNNKSNSHLNENNDDESTNDVFLELPKYKLNQINNKNNDQKNNLLTYELINKLIDEELEEIYKEQNLKIKDTSKEIEEKIKELKEKVIPKIIDKINDEKIKNEDELKKEVKETLEEELKEKPLFIIRDIKSPLTNEERKSPDNYLDSKNTKKNKDNLNNKIENNKLNTNSKDKTNNLKKDIINESIYSIAKPRKKTLKLKENNVNKANRETKISTISNSSTLDAKLLNTPLKMVQNPNKQPKTSFKDNITQSVLITSLVAANITKEIITNPSNKKNENENSKNTNLPPSNENNHIPELKKEETKPKNIAEITEIQIKLEEKIKNLENNQKKADEENKLVSPIDESKITALTDTSKAIITDSLNETKKDDLDDKDYDRVERQIDKMLEDISNTYLRYEEKMTPKQKNKLKQEEAKLRNTKEEILACKSKDIAFEKKQLTEEISSKEITGLKEELEKLDIENKIEANDSLMKKLNNLEGITKDQVKNVDKRILNKRLKKASLLLEMTSLLAFPFIRNKYFLYFTVGLLIDNHFNFINSFFNRKLNKYEPADLNQIKKGQDALDGALDITYKNLIELDYLEEKALSRYPELAYDPEFINQITNLRSKLSHNYNKLMRKNKTMEKYYIRTKQQKKILKKDLKQAA